jgi:GNAT superfamily N-acetyltransferase
VDVTFRPGTIANSEAVFWIFHETVMDLGQRTGTMPITGGSDPQVLQGLWEARRSLYEHLARTADQFWIAERAGQPFAYARSVLRDGMRELTEFFVLPTAQSGGVGRELLARAFAEEGAAYRSVVATIDVRALARYMKAGLTPRFPIFYFTIVPTAVPVPAGLTAEPIDPVAAPLAMLAQIDRAVLGHHRSVDHAWLVGERQGFMFHRSGELVGYGYVGQSSGPFALLDPADTPAVLAHAECIAAERGYVQFGLDVPAVNRAAITYLQARGYRIDPFFTLYLSDEPLGAFDHYICTTPTFFI